jgi:hypothetical protein
VRHVDEDAELPVPETRNEAYLANANGVHGRVALGFKGEVDRDGVRGWPEDVLSDCVAPAIAAGQAPSAEDLKSVGSEGSARRPA